MLSIASIASGGGAANYYAGDNYYTDGQLTEASLWLGQSAEVLAFTQASGPQGGAGALIVLLKG